jgi:anti-sigma regulatory factor (Ser/Thr protein kinase)
VPQFVFYLPCDPHTVSRVRAILRRLAPAWRYEGILDSVELVASELVTNVVVHTADHAWLQLVREGGVIRLATLDADTHKAELREPGPADEAGRGLVIVQALSSCFGVEYVGHGKRVWAELALPEVGGAFRAYEERVCLPRWR